VLVNFDEFARFGGRDRAPGVPGDLDDHERDCEADDRVGDVGAERDADRARDDAERDEAVDSGVVAVGDQRRAREAPAGPVADGGGALVADETHQTGGGQRPEVRELLRVDEALDRLVERDAGACEDRRDDEEPGQLLSAEAA
jgi:hypothetical protein